LELNSHHFFAGNPITTFELTDEPTKKDISQGGFKVTAKIKCASDSKAITDDIFEGNLNPFNQPSVKIPLTIKDGSFLVKVYSKDSEGKEHETFNANLGFNKLILTDPAEKNLGELNIGSDRILKYVPQGEYESQQRIAVSGVIDVAWRDFPSVDYRLNLEESDIPTFRTVQITKSSEPDIIECADGETRQGDVCVKVNNNSNNNSNNVKTISEFEGFTLCLQSSGFSCFLQQPYLSYSTLIFGSLFLIGAVFHNSTPKFDQFGRRI
jgi:hypothetical protein